MATAFEIRVMGHLSQDWSEWLEGMVITHTPEGETVLAGPLRDQAALFGILTKVHDLGLVLIAVNRVERSQTSKVCPLPIGGATSEV